MTDPPPFNTLRPRQDGRHFADDILKCIFLNEDVWIANEISLKFVPKGPNWQYSSIGLDNGLAPSRRQAIIWTNDVYISDAYMRHSASMSSDHGTYETSAWMVISGMCNFCFWYLISVNVYKTRFSAYETVWV